MQIRKHILLVAISIGFVTTVFSQRRPHGVVNIKNGFGIGGGLTQFDIKTDNFETKAGQGWIAGLAATLDLPHRWYTVSYGMQVSESNIEIMGRSLPTASTEAMDYKLMMVQMQFLFHAKLAKDYLMIDAGPMLQYNGELELKDSSKNNYILDGYSALTAQDISDISKFNVNASIGATAGFNHFKLRVQYIYGLTNMFNKLNDQNLDASPSNDTFKGNQSMLAFMAFIYF
ncbi:PorT family protein [Subsaxibacter sp. CAU 1640]|uniref:outer membrane beta-barrel protein n=1 Tax=Subsaxibacter sp. CAU 1640 TaxID=2933271 RepID=UPI0020058B44|nr:outer membrane beta-barrel protein [Subsaxibacter sp. CAU 1640]MCK7589498.1 PorT family protein [Subsaxibacter sp. CAU 1640]